MDLTIHSNLVIPSIELQWRFSRSSGSGGQNLNKTESRVELIFDIQKSRTLTLYQKFHIKEKLRKKLIRNRISIVVQEKRTQYQNRQLAILQLTKLLREGLKPASKPRKETKPTKSSQKRRVESKVKRGKLKKSRQSKLDADY